MSWRPPPPCKVGDDVSQVDTPALVVDMTALEANLTRLPQIMESWPKVAVRTHVKAHKTPEIARLQVRQLYLKTSPTNAPLYFAVV